MSAIYAPTISSTFESSTELWWTDDSIEEFGQQNGVLYGIDDATGGTWFFNAPVRYLGDKSAYHGGTLSFDLKVGGDQTGPYDWYDVYLTGANGHELFLDLDHKPGYAWTSYTVPLDASADWRWESMAGRQATDAEIAMVLADLEGLSIRGEYSDGADKGYLDNVALAPSVDPAGYNGSFAYSFGPQGTVTVSGSRSLGNSDGTETAQTEVLITGPHGERVAAEITTTVTGDSVAIDLALEGTLGSLEIIGSATADGGGSATVTVTDPQGASETLSGDLGYTDGLVVLTLDPDATVAGDETLVTLDPADPTLTVTDAEGNTTSLDYGGLVETLAQLDGKGAAQVLDDYLEAIGAEVSACGDDDPTGLVCTSDAGSGKGIEAVWSGPTVQATLSVAVAPCDSLCASLDGIA